MHPGSSTVEMNGKLSAHMSHDIIDSTEHTLYETSTLTSSLASNEIVVSVPGKVNV